MSDNKHPDEKDNDINLNDSVDDQGLSEGDDDALTFNEEHDPDSWEDENGDGSDSVDASGDEDDEEEEYDEEEEDDEEEEFEDEEFDDESALNQSGSMGMAHIALFAIGSAAIVGGGGYYAYKQGMLASIFPSEKTSQTIAPIATMPLVAKTSPILVEPPVVKPVSVASSIAPVMATKADVATQPAKGEPLVLSASQPVLDTTKTPASEVGFGVAERERSKIEAKTDSAFGLAKESAEKIASLEGQIKAIESHLESVNGYLIKVYTQGKSIESKFDAVEEAVTLNVSQYKSLDLKLKQLRVELDKESENKVSEVSVRSIVADGLSQVSEEIDGFLNSISQVDDRVNSLENKRREFTELDSASLPFVVNGKERAIGFNVINATPDENMSVLLTPTRNVIVVFLGEKVMVDGKSRTVTAIEDGGFKVYFDDRYFVDGHRMEELPAKVKQAKASAKIVKQQKEQKKVEKKAQEIAKIKAKEEVAAMPAVPAMPEQDPTVREAHRGLSVVMVIEGNRFVLKTRDGLFVKAKEGLYIPGYEELGKVGVFITNQENGMNGILLIGEESFIVSK